MRTLRLTAAGAAALAMLAFPLYACFDTITGPTAIAGQTQGGGPSSNPTPTPDPCSQAVSSVTITGSTPAAVGSQNAYTAHVNAVSGSELPAACEATLKTNWTVDNSTVLGLAGDVTGLVVQAKCLAAGSATLTDSIASLNQSGQYKVTCQ
ncbi:MAG TPA: hypothetical protein VKW04_24925 [Planctomycetota bacterium]|nr:hypothetical protein [Planctomycetota bacterium]